MRLIDFFERGAARWPDNACLIDEAVTLTYRDASAFSHRLASALIAGGARPGDSVAIWSPNTARAFLAWLGLARAGAAWIGLAALWKPDDVVEVLNDRGTAWLLFDGEFAEAVKALAPRVPSLRHLVCLDRALPGVVSLDELIAGQDVSAPELPFDPHAIVNHFTTGGTTGRPKGSMWSNLNWLTWTANMYAHLPMGDRPVHLIAASMTHAAGIFAWAVLPFGGAIVLVRRAEPEAIFDAVERYAVTHSFLPPTVIYMLLAHPRARTANLTSLRCLIYGGAPMSAEKARQAVELFGPCLAQIYGQSECPCTISILTPEEHVEAIRDPVKAHRLASCGRPPVFTQVAIIDDDGNPLSVGERGEIGVRGPIVHAGYFNNPEATAQSRANGWHRTGDVGFFDADGYLYIVDRKKDMIISGGLNVYPGEIEQVIWAHPAVQDCAVIGVPDEKWGEAVKAVIELKPGATLDPKEVLSMCREKLGGYRTPKSVEVWPELPRSAVGKVLKREIRARFWAGRERTI